MEGQATPVLGSRSKASLLFHRDPHYDGAGGKLASRIRESSCPLTAARGSYFLPTFRDVLRSANEDDTLWEG